MHAHIPYKTIRTHCLGGSVSMRSCRTVSVPLQGELLNRDIHRCKGLKLALVSNRMYNKEGVHVLFTDTWSQ